MEPSPCKNLKFNLVLSMEVYYVGKCRKIT